MSINDEVLFTAISVSVAYHGLQKDRVGNLYILHPLAVMGNVSSKEEKAVAVLHDILEDTTITAQVLSELKVPEEIIEAIVILTRQKGEDYDLYIDKIIESKNKLAMRVKIADLDHNISRWRDLTDTEMRGKLLTRYLKAKAFLEVELGEDL